MALVSVGVCRNYVVPLPGMHRLCSYELRRYISLHIIVIIIIFWPSAHIIPREFKNWDENTKLGTIISLFSL